MQLLPATTIAAAVSATAGKVLQMAAAKGGPRNLTIQTKFLYGAGGTTVDAYVQTSFDGGTTWVDIANFHFTTAAATKIANLSSMTPVTTLATPTDGSLTSNTVVDGLIGDKLRVKYATVGTYTGATSLEVDVVSNERLVAAS